MKKGKLLSAFTSLALAGTMLASALPFTASAASVQTDLQLSMSADKTSFSLDEIKAGAKATVYVNADGEFQTANITSLGAKFKSSDWRVRAKNVEISYRNQIANNNGDRFSSFYSIATFGEWTKDFPVDQDMYEEYEGEIEDPISYAVKAKTAISDTNMPAIQIISNKNIGYFKKGTGSSVAHFDVEFPTDLEAGTYTIDFADVQLPVGIDDYGHLGDGIAKSATGITFTVGDSQPTTEPVTTTTTKATTAATSASGIQLSRDYTGTVKLSAEKVSAAAGDKKVALNIYADTNGFTIENLTFKVQYDSKLTLNTEESFKKGLGIRPGTTTFEASTNTYLFIISGDTPAKNYTDKPIGTLYFDVAADAEGELPVQLVPGQGLAKIECLQYSESKNGLKKFYLDPEVTDGAVVIGDAVTSTTAATTKATTDSGIQLSRDYTGTVKLSAEKVKAAAGDKQVALNIYADTNGFTVENLTFMLKYDSSALTLSGTSNAEAFKKGLGLRPGTTTFERSTNVYLFIISGDTPAKNYADKPIGTIYFDVADDASGEIPVELVPGQGLSKIECLQYSESKNGLKKFYLDPEVTNGAVIIDDDVTTPADTTVTTTKASTDTTTTSVTSVATTPAPTQITSASVSASASASASVSVSVSKETDISVSNSASASVSVSISKETGVSVSNSASASVSVSVSKETDISVSNSASASVSVSVSVSISIVSPVDTGSSSASSVTNTGSGDTTKVSISIDTSATDVYGNDVNWYFADEKAFDTASIKVVDAEGNEVEGANIDFGDATPANTYDGKTFDYVVAFTVSVDGEEAGTGEINVKIGQRGDANCNHKVDARDAAAIAKDLAQLYGSKKTTLTAKEGEFALFLANVDRGTAKKATDWYGLRDLNARDAAKIAQYLSQKYGNPNLKLVDLVKDPKLTK